MYTVHRRFDCVLTAMAPPITPVQHISSLREGDHVKWKRLPGYDHHALVERADRKSGTVHIIEYGKDDEGFGFDRGVVKRSKVHGVTGMYKYNYGQNECYDSRRVLQRAQSRLRERRYNPLTNNCEHLATWSKSGQKRSSQIQPFVARTSGSGGIALENRSSSFH